MNFRISLAVATVGLLALAALVILPAAPATAQATTTPAEASVQEVQDEGSAYRAWHRASQAGDSAKAIEAAKAYLAKYPNGQYAEFLNNWLPTAKMGALDAAIKEKRAADIATVGRDILADDPENLNVVYSIALFGAPPDSIEFARKGIAMIEAGKTLSGVDNFDKNGTLGRLTQVLAVDAHKSGNSEEAIKLYQQSTALAPDDVQVVAKNTYAVYALRSASYAEAAKAWNAIPEADKTAAEPTPEVKAALEQLNQESDTLVDAAATFVAFATAKDIVPAARDKVNQTLEAVYKVRHPEDAELAGLKKLLEEKAAAPAAPAAESPAPEPQAPESAAPAAGD